MTTQDMRDIYEAQPLLARARSLINDRRHRHPDGTISLGAYQAALADLRGRATLLYRRARDAHKDFDKVLDTFEDGIRRIQKLVRKVEVKR